MDVSVSKYYKTTKAGKNEIKIKYEEGFYRPAWVQIDDSNFEARFLDLKTPVASGIIYKRFTGGFYYPIDMNREEEGRFYKEYAKYYDKFTLVNNLPMAEYVLEKLAQYGIKKDSKILDLGSGTGIFSSVASKSGYSNLTLFDISPYMLDEAKKKTELSNALFLSGNVIDYDFTEIYDVFVSIMMFDSLSDKELVKTLKKLSKNINRGGYAIIIEDMPRDEWKQYFEIIEEGNRQFKKDGFSKFCFVAKRL